MQIDGEPLYLLVNEIHFEFESESIVRVKVEESIPLSSTAGVRDFKNPVQRYRGF